MRVLHERCCGLDIHKQFVVACLLRTTAEGSVDKEIRTFNTMTTDLLALCDWLAAEQCTHVVRESTASFWRPIDPVLEGHVELLVVNAAHIKAAPGRKTDVKDAEWLAELLRHGLVRHGLVRHGLVRPSFIPSPPQLHSLPSPAAAARPHALSHPAHCGARATHESPASRAGGCQ
jgi:transposase